MSAVTAPRVAIRPPGSSSAVVAALALVELRRTLRNPVLWIGVGASAWQLWQITPASEDWASATYAGTAISSGYLLLAISFVSAVSFHRERIDVAQSAPVRAELRMVGRLMAAIPLVAIAAGFAALVAWRERSFGGLALGTEPGRTNEALHTLPELLQHPLLAVLAVALGAAAGRRTARLVAVVPLLFMFWLTTAATYWLFGHRDVTPFSVVQVQPLFLPAGPASTDPLSFPSSWLLEAPTDYEPDWMRLYVSEALASWHDVWLVGLASLLLAAAWPSRGRRWLVGVGSVLAIVGVAGQYLVIP